MILENDIVKNMKKKNHTEEKSYRPVQAEASDIEMLNNCVFFETKNDCLPTQK